MAFELTFDGTTITGFTGTPPAHLDLTGVVNGSGQAITDISGAAFQGKTTITTLTLADTIVTIGANAFFDCDITGALTIPNSVTTIGQFAFYGNTKLTSLTLGTGVTTIGANAFGNCDITGTLTIPDAVTSIGNYAFLENANLTQVTVTNFNSGDITLGTRAFGSLVTNGNGVWKTFLLTFVGTKITGFLGTVPAHLNLTGVTNNSGQAITDISGSAFGSQTTITTLTLADTIVTIGNYAFTGNTKLTSLSLGTGVTTIGADAFNSCDITGALTIPNSVTTIGNQAFISNAKLTSVTFGTGLTSLGDLAFGSCTLLASAVFNSTPTMGGGGVFFNTAIPSSFGPNNISNGQIKLVKISGFDFIFTRTTASSNAVTNSLVTLSDLPENASYAIVGRSASNNPEESLDGQFYNIKLYDIDNLPITSFPTPISVTINGLNTTVSNLYIKTSATLDGTYTYETNTATKNQNGSYTFTINHLTFIQGDEDNIDGGGGGGDPYISTITGAHYKLPMIEAPIRYYQGTVDGKQLTVNVTLRNLESSEMVGTNLKNYVALKDHIPKNLRNTVLTKLFTPETLNFFEKVYISYGASHVLLDVWDQKFKVLSVRGDEIKSSAGDSSVMDTYTREYKTYKNSTLTLKCGSAKVHVVVYDAAIVRSGIVIQAPRMEAGNGVIVNTLSASDMTLSSLQSLDAVPRRDARVESHRETFIDARGLRVRKIAQT